MPKVIDIKGKKFNKLLVESFFGIDKRDGAIWTCLCDCGNRKNVLAYNLKRGKAYSCGCVRRFTKRTYIDVKHGSARNGKITSEYRSWQHMRDRCINTNCEAYPNYGGRGIAVCDRWVGSFENFFLDMGKKPKGYTIERINNDGNYEPSNCKWESRSEQSKNTRTCKLVLDTNTGIFYVSMTEAAYNKGIKYSILRSKIKINGYAGLILV